MPQLSHLPCVKVQQSYRACFVFLLLSNALCSCICCEVSNFIEVNHPGKVQLYNKLPALYEAGSFITAFTRVYPLSLF